MKEYSSPICEIETMMMPDIITLSFHDVVNLDNDAGIDKIYW